MDKPKVKVVSPAGVCGCAFAVWIEKVWDILTKYQDRLEIETLTSDSPLAHELGIGGRTVVINGEVIPVILLEKKILEFLRREK